MTLSTKLELLRTISVLDKGKVKNEGVSKTAATRRNTYNVQGTTTTKITAGKGKDRELFSKIRV